MRYDREQIDHWMKEWEESGQSIYTFCRDKPFDKSTFYNWRKKSVVDDTRHRDSKFISVSMVPSCVPQLSIQYPNGVKVDIHTTMSIEAIRLLAGC